MSPGAQARDDGRPSPDEIRAYLARLLGTAAFQASDRRRRLLAYVVEQTLAGRADRLKAFDLAVAVLGRDERFDPQTTRSCGSRSAGCGATSSTTTRPPARDDPIRIDDPQGGLRAGVRGGRGRGRRPPEPPRPPPRRACSAGRARRPRPLAGGAVGRRPVARPLVAAGSAPSEHGRAGTRAVVGRHAVRRALGERESARLLGDRPDRRACHRPAALRRSCSVYAGGPASADGPGQRRRRPSPCASKARCSGTRRAIRVSARLVDRGVGRGAVGREVRPAGDHGERARGRGRAGRRDRRAAGVAERRHRRRRRAPGRRHPTRARMFAYDCVQRAFALPPRRRTTRRAAPPSAPASRRRWRATPATPTPGRCWPSSTWTAPGWAGASRRRSPASSTASRRRRERAVELAPERHPQPAGPGQRPLQRRGTSTRPSASSGEAIALSPHDPETLAQLGWRLMARGRWTRAPGSCARRSTAAGAARPGTTRALALAHYFRGELRARLRRGGARARASAAGSGQATLAITAAGLGHAERGPRGPRPGARPVAAARVATRAAFWQVWHVEERLIDRLVAGLRKAGLVVTLAG